jgi:Flp pilus assembly protein CpaB
VQDVFAGRLFKTRGGAVLIGVIAAVLAAILLIVYLRSYRSSVNSGTRPMTVLVAKSLIPKGTAGSLIAQRGLYQVTTVPKDQLKALAIADPAGLNDRIAAADIFPGQQLTQGAFTTETVGSVSSKLSGVERAIAIPLDSSHGLIGVVQAGDHVDVYVGVNGSAQGPVLKLLAPNILVVLPPGASGGGNAILQVTTKQAATFAFASDNARLWLVLRPVIGAKPTPPSFMTAAALLAGTTPLGR